MRNKALDARLLPAEEPSVRSPVPVQPQRQDVFPPPAAQCALQAAWRRHGSAVTRVCAHARTRLPVTALLPCTSERGCQSAAFEQISPPRLLKLHKQI